MCVDWQWRVVELEAIVAAKEPQIAEQQTQIAVLREQNAALQEQLEALTRQVAELTEKLNQNSRNSHKPPSSDGPGQRKARDKGDRGKKKKKSQRKRGAQKGHEGKHRELVPAENVDDFVHHFPLECENCWEKLAEIPDADPTRFQVTEVPPIVPHVTEHQLHAVLCKCGHCTRATDEDVPASAFGPRLMALVALLTGVYHVSRRKTVQLLSDMVGVRMSLGSVSNIEYRVSEAIKPAVDSAWEHVNAASVKHADATGWLVSGVAFSLWTLASKAATVFRIFADGRRATIESFFGKRFGVLVSDRATVFGFWAMENRQICWAHLLRKFVAFSEREGPAKSIGNELLDLTALVFEYWHSYQDASLDKRTFLAWMAPVQRQFEAVLERAVDANVDRLSGACADMWAHRHALWTFVETVGVEPTNNHAERELRAFVLWRKRSFGAQSDRGNRFAERIMTVAHTARKQEKDTLEFLTDACRAQHNGIAAPHLFDAPIAAPA